MSEFNPGPWQFFSDMHGHPYITNEDGGVVAWIAPDTCYEAFDTASLIAAAPDLLAVIRYAVDNPDFNSDVFDQTARAAIAKATGATQ